MSRYARLFAAAAELGAVVMLLPQVAVAAPDEAATPAAAGLTGACP